MDYLPVKRSVIIFTAVFYFVGVATFDVVKKPGSKKTTRSAYTDSCALHLDNDGKSSLVDYSDLTLLGEGVNFHGPGTCITYGAVNKALKIAIEYTPLRRPDNEWSQDELATVGELFLEVSRILAKYYGLNPYQIIENLPLLDTSHTDLIHFCPDYLSPINCYPGRYRRHDGLCNNLEHPTWGARFTSFNRMLPPVYGDGISEPRLGYDGYPLPNPRKISALVHNDEVYHDHAVTLMVVAWGQFMDHDFTLQGTPLDPNTKNEFEDCCHRPSDARSRYCMNLEIPADDHFYGKYGVTCQDFVRGFPGVPHGCRLGARSQFNQLTATIDGNTVYGVSESVSRGLRTGYGGLLKMNKFLNKFGLKDLLPPRTENADEGCARPDENSFCFLAGEIRVNEQLILASIHTLMAREHNRIAYELALINPHWDDDQIYHEARHIVVAMIQHITFNEFLPVLLGKEIMKKFDLLLQKEGYWNGYDKNVNPGIIGAFATAAFRFGHSLLPTNVERWSRSHKHITSTRLSDLIRQPFQLYEPGVMDQYYIGLSNQVAQAMDDFVTGEVTNLLFKKAGSPFGVDLASFNLLRAREFGIPGYMQYRRYCGIPEINDWDDLLGSMSNATVFKYKNVYRHPEDIDLWSGGVVERALPGSILGPTFACIIATQFSNVRKGDRFWYELQGQPSSFSHEQLAEIRKVRLARVICDNSDTIDTLQMYPMVLPDHQINPRVSCKSSILPYMDLTKWADLTYPSTFQKSITSVRPLPYPQSSIPIPHSKNGKYIPEAAFARLREALSTGRYSGYFVAPHLKAPEALLPGGAKPLPTRRPVILSQEYLNNDQGGNVYFPETILNKRISEVSQLLESYQPYSSDASVYRDLQTIMDFLPIQEKSLNGFIPTEGPLGNITMYELFQLAGSYIDESHFPVEHLSPQDNSLGLYDLSLLASENRVSKSFSNDTSGKIFLVESKHDGKDVLKEITGKKSKRPKRSFENENIQTLEDLNKASDVQKLKKLNIKKNTNVENTHQKVTSDLFTHKPAKEFQSIQMTDRFSTLNPVTADTADNPSSLTNSVLEPLENEQSIASNTLTLTSERGAIPETSATSSMGNFAKTKQELQESIEEAVKTMKAFDSSFLELQKKIEGAKGFFKDSDPQFKNIKALLNVEVPKLNITVIKPHDIHFLDYEKP
ncbi:uncharacterized protein LOC136035403 [Artemia franciscana]|uniref:uncharacterized protein LOC136035403 n=1 Tax=Artemia franciscana TaxID=6661 RepID=UPI0032DA6099